MVSEEAAVTLVMDGLSAARGLEQLEKRGGGVEDEVGIDIGERKEFVGVMEGGECPSIQSCLGFRRS